ncbi:flagellar hook-associated protein FlgL [Populibacterium corticicola]|uniref:Flagellar hook-associated protein FlgL n=1 Tax=Populibacterium corticicola TaxID=1812826 RepID=A0ABW5XK72_9MICO
MTHQSTQRSVLSNMQQNLAAMARLQEQASSGRVIQRTSDDPAKASDALSLRREQAQSAQYKRNAEDGLAWLNNIDTALNTTSSLLRRARDLVVRASNDGTMNEQTREAIAAELDGIKESLLGQANTKYLGRNLFAGTSGSDTAFDTTTYGFNGHAGSSVERRTADDVTIRVDSDGGAVFGTSATYDPADPGAYSVFSMIDDLAADIRAGNNPQDYLNRIDERVNVVLTQVAKVGASTNQIERSAESLGHKVNTLKNDIAGIENIDLAETLIELQMQEVAYQSSLNAASRVLQPSLLDYLR